MGFRRVRGGVGIMTNVQETSLEAYTSIQSELGERQTQVLKTLRSSDTPGCMNNRMIAETLDIPINSVTPRVKELREKGLVVEAGKSPCPYTKRKTLFWKAVKE